MNNKTFNDFKKGILFEACTRSGRRLYLKKVRAGSYNAHVIEKDGYGHPVASEYDGQESMNIYDMFNIRQSTICLLDSDDSRKEAERVFAQGIVERSTSPSELSDDAERELSAQPIAWEARGESSMAQLRQQVNTIDSMYNRVVPRRAGPSGKYIELRGLTSPSMFRTVISDDIGSF